MARIGDAMLQLSVVSKQQKSFAVRVQTACRIKTGKRDIISQRRMHAIAAELADHAMRFVKQQDAAHSITQPIERPASYSMPTTGEPNVPTHKSAEQRPENHRKQGPFAACPRPSCHPFH